MEQFIRVMKALSDPNRVKILKMLQHKSMCVCELRVALGIAQPTASNHLKILEEAGLVGYRKSGLWVNYHLAEGDDSPYSAAMLGGLRHWLKDDPEVLRLIDSLPTIHREDICKRPLSPPPATGVPTAAGRENEQQGQVRDIRRRVAGINKVRNGNHGSE